MANDRAWQERYWKYKYERERALAIRLSNLCKRQQMIIRQLEAKQRHDGNLDRAARGRTANRNRYGNGDTVFPWTEDPLKRNLDSSTSNSSNVPSIKGTGSNGLLLHKNRVGHRRIKTCDISDLNCYRDRENLTNVPSLEQYEQTHALPGLRISPLHPENPGKMVEGSFLCGIDGDSIGTKMCHSYATSIYSELLGNRSSSTIPRAGTHAHRCIVPEHLSLDPRVLCSDGEETSKLAAYCLNWVFPGGYRQDVCSIDAISRGNISQTSPTDNDKTSETKKTELMRKLSIPQLHCFTLEANTGDNSQSEQYRSSTRYFACLSYPQPICLDWRRLTSCLDGNLSEKEDSDIYSSDTTLLMNRFLSILSTCYYCISWRSLVVYSRYPFFDFLEQVLHFSYSQFISQNIEDEIELIIRVSKRSAELTYDGDRGGDLLDRGVRFVSLDGSSDSVQLRSAEPSSPHDKPSSKSSKFPSLKFRWKNSKDSAPTRGGKRWYSFNESQCDIDESEDGSESSILRVALLLEKLAKSWPAKLNNVATDLFETWICKHVLTLHVPPYRHTINVVVPVNKSIGTVLASAFSWSRPDTAAAQHRWMPPSDFDIPTEKSLRVCGSLNSSLHDEKRIVGIPVGSAEACELIHRYAFCHILQNVPVHALVSLLGSLLVEDRVIIAGRNLVDTQKVARRLRNANAFLPRSTLQNDKYRAPNEWLQDRYTTSLLVMFVHSLLYPLRWTGPCITLLPRKLSGFLSSPVAFIIGIESLDKDIMEEVEEGSVVFNLYNGCTTRLPNRNDGAQYENELTEKQLEPQLPQMNSLHHSLMETKDDEGAFVGSIRRHVLYLLAETVRMAHPKEESRHELFKRMEVKLSQEQRDSEIPFWRRFLETQMMELFYSNLRKFTSY